MSKRHIVRTPQSKCQCAEQLIQPAIHGQPQQRQTMQKVQEVIGKVTGPQRQTSQFANGMLIQGEQAVPQAQNCQLRSWASMGLKSLVSATGRWVLSVHIHHEDLNCIHGKGIQSISRSSGHEYHDTKDQDTPADELEATSLET